MPIAIMTVVSMTVMAMTVPMVMMSFVSVTSVWGARARARIVISVGSFPMAMIAGRHCVDFSGGGRIPLQIVKESDNQSI
jgi:hypothetical protein